MKNLHWENDRLYFNYVWMATIYMVDGKYRVLIPWVAQENDYNTAEEVKAVAMALIAMT